MMQVSLWHFELSAVWVELFSTHLCVIGVSMQSEYSFLQADVDVTVLVSTSKRMQLLYSVTSL